MIFRLATIPQVFSIVRLWECMYKVVRLLFYSIKITYVVGFVLHLSNYIEKDYLD